MHLTNRYCSSLGTGEQRNNVSDLLSLHSNGRQAMKHISLDYDIYWEENTLG